MYIFINLFVLCSFVNHNVDKSRNISRAYVHVVKCYLRSV